MIIHIILVDVHNVGNGLFFDMYAKLTADEFIARNTNQNVCIHGCKDVRIYISARLAICVSILFGQKIKTCLTLIIGVSSA